MSRPALALVYGRAVIPGRAGYADGDALYDAYAAGRFARSWWLGARLVSAQATAAEGKGMWKAAERLPTDVPGELLPALEKAGVHHPASFADCYHQLAPRTPILRATYSRLFEWWPGGPWAEARLPGSHRGHWYRYDLRQAYRWAATLGLPLPDTFEVTRNYRGQAGLWIATIESDTAQLPAVFRQAGPVVVSTEEIEGYKLRVQVWRGVVWRRTHPADYVERTLAKLPCPNEAGRAYWGRWIARDPLLVRTAAREWSLRINPFRNFIWGWLIVGRVRLRVWQAAAKAAHVYVDEILVPEPIDTGADVLGAWRPKAEYPDGVTIHRTGHWGPRRGPAIMHTGEVRNAS